MSNWQVVIKQTEEYNLEVEADSEDEAIEKAWALLTPEGKGEYHNDSDSTNEAWED